MSFPQKGLLVIKGGVQSSIQDCGRQGFSDIGLTQSGAMDEVAFGYANYLVGNSFNTPCVEIALGGLVLKARSSQSIAICGANMQPSLNGKPIALWQTHHMQSGDELSFGFASEGQFTYLAVAGGLKTPYLYGSFSTSIKEGLGGIEGRKLQEGDVLPSEGKRLFEKRRLKPSLIPSYPQTITLRVLPGYQEELFDAKAQETFYQTPYVFKGEGDRMGYRLSGEKVVPKVTGILSEPICYGAVQIPSHGEPIILLKERQTIGGYPKIGSVLACDCFKLAQLRAGGTIHFQKIDVQEARRLSLASKAFFTF